MGQKIVAIFVVYHPDIEFLKKSLHSINNQVDKTYIIDNSASGDIQDAIISFFDKLNHIEFISLPINVGIAKAQNIGILKAIEAQASFSLLSDQDTIYPSNYIKSMMANFNSIVDNCNVAAIAPNFQELNKNIQEGYFILEGVNSRALESKAPIERVPQVIASGMIIQNSVISAVGLMDELLFIDWVDFEWCWRAGSMGYDIVGCNNVIINHTLGDSVIEIHDKKYSSHSPERNYYIVRNGISIALTKKYLTFKMRWFIFLKSIRYMIAFTCLGKRPLLNLVLCSKGLYHGLFGRLGPLAK